MKLFLLKVVAKIRIKLAKFRWFFADFLGLVFKIDKNNILFYGKKYQKLSFY